MARGPFSGMAAADEGAFERLVKSINPSWIEQALEATGTATLRKRRLPADQVIWLVLEIALIGTGRSTTSSIVSTWCCRGCMTRSPSREARSRKRGLGSVTSLSVGFSRGVRRSGPSRVRGDTSAWARPVRRGRNHGACAGLHRQPGSLRRTRRGSHARSERIPARSRRNRTGIDASLSTWKSGSLPGCGDIESSGDGW